jgi:hypothetical protein
MSEGQILDGYHIIRRIGSGGFGDFLLCDPLLIGRTHIVFIKLSAGLYVGSSHDAVLAGFFPNKE